MVAWLLALAVVAAPTAPVFEWRPLIPADDAHPKMWTYPAAVEVQGEAVRVWYQRVDKEEKEYADQRVLCLGTLTTAGFAPEKMREGAPAWGGVDNVVLRRSPHKPTWGGFNVFQMTHEPKGYHLLYWDQPAQGEAGALLAESADGIAWTKDETHAVFTEHNDAYTLIRAGEGFRLYQTMLEDWPDKPYKDNLDKKRRVIALRSSPDLKTWSPQAVVLRPDAQDPPETEFYLMKTFPHAGGFAGLIMKYYGDPARPGEHSAILKNELVLSKDGEHWKRPWRDVDLGFWTYADPFPWQGKIAFVVGKDRGLWLVTGATLTPEEKP